MKFYDLETVFTFGKFKGKTLREVFEIQPSYVEWCCINLDHFYIDIGKLESLVSEKLNHLLRKNQITCSGKIKSIIIESITSKEAKNKLSEKYEIWKNEQKDWENEQYDEEDHYHDYDINDYEISAYSNYSDDYPRYKTMCDSCSDAGCCLGWDNCPMGW